MVPKDYRQPRCPHGWVDATQCEPCKTAAERDVLRNEIDRLQIAAQAVIDRWNSPKWDWHKQGPTADLIAALHAALLPDNAEVSGLSTRTPGYRAGTTGEK